MANVERPVVPGDVWLMDETGRRVVGVSPSGIPEETNLVSSAIDPVTGGIDKLIVNGLPFNVAGLKARRMVFIGDSLSEGGSRLSPQQSISRGRPWFGSTTSITTTNLGGGSFKSQPQKLISGTTSFTMRIRAGAAASATGTVGVREFRIEKVSAPTY